MRGKHAYQRKERAIVAPPNAIIEPIAMMIKFITAFIALPTMFGILPNVALAYRTSQFVFGVL